ncbi:MAG: sugar phosphate nucleotidyltransferase [Dehalococcoidia bacterium]
MPNKKINRAVILAAGDGDRMGELTTDLPKVLLPRNMQEPIIVSPIAALAAVGIKHIAIVVGYLANEVKRKLGDGTQYGVKLHYIENPHYLGGNAISAWKAKSWTTGEPVILCMGDHIIEPNMVWCLLSTKEITDTLCIEYRPTQYHIIEGATKVALFEDGSIQDIGKELTRWDALDTGVFLLTERFFNAVEELARLRGNNIEMSDVIRFMVAQGHRFDTCNVSECSWMDIDTVEDLELARSKGH